MKRISFTAWVVALTALPMLLLNTSVAAGVSAVGQPKPVTKYFPQTAHAVKGRFLEYWETQGGVMQQGYPLSDEMQEVSQTDGKTYTVQYFERAVFEGHPENRQPHDVLLSLLGAFEYNQRYGKSGAPNQHANTDHAITFPQTGKTLGGQFRVYWEAHGGLGQQGYPISNEFTEVSSLNGKPYTVQYFQRAVFEWHPDNPAQFKVLLGQLGRFRWNAKYGVLNSAPRQIASQAIRFPIAVSNYLFWISVQPNKSVYGYDVSQGRQFLITSPGPDHDIYRLASDGKTVAWTEDYSHIKGYDLSTGKEFAIVDAEDPHAIGDAPGAGIALENGVLYYADVVMNSQTNEWEEGSIYAYNLATKAQRKLVEHGRNPVVKDGVLLWSHFDPQSGDDPSVMTLHALKLDGSMGDTLLSSGLALHYYSGYQVSGDSVVWAGSGQEAGVYLYNLKTHTRSQLPGQGGINPFVRGNKVVWTEEPNGGLTGGAPADWSIVTYDTATRMKSLATQLHTEWAQATGITSQGVIAYFKGQVYRDLFLLGPESIK